MGVERVVVTLINAKQQQEQRRWHANEVIANLAWLKRMNARGFDVLVRPDGAHGLLLLDGLSKADLQMLRERGFAPAAVVQPVAEQYQAWVRLSVKPLGEALRSNAAAGLVLALAQAGAHAVSLPDGRLAGFTNQQVQSADGRHPYVLTTEGGGKLAPAAAGYLAYVEQLQDKAEEFTRDGHRHSGIER